MKTFVPVMLICGLPFVVYLRFRLTKSRPSDHLAIEEFLKDRGLRQIRVTRDDNYWRYWIRGRLSMSNCARIYVVQCESPDGPPREIHIAFDDWSLTRGKLQVVLEREATPGEPKSS